MSPEIVSILALVVIFAIATFLPINMGALAFVAAFLVGTLSVGLSTDDILAGFPAELVVTLIGPGPTTMVGAAVPAFSALAAWPLLGEALPPLQTTATVRPANSSGRSRTAAWG